MSFLVTRDGIDPDRIGAVGICASGGYVPYAAQTDVRIKAVATVSAVDLGSVMRDGPGPARDPQALRTMLERASAARTAEARGEPVPRQEWITEAVDAETREYYRTARGHHPRAVQPWPVRSLDQIIQYDSYALIHLISPRPLLMIVGSEADTAHFSRDAIEKAAEPKELFVIDGGTHVSLYDRDEHVTPAVAKVTAFLTAHLRHALRAFLSDRDPPRPNPSDNGPVPGQAGAGSPGRTTGRARPPHRPCGARPCGRGRA